MGGGCSRCCASCVMCCYGCKRSRSYTQKMNTKMTERIWFFVMAFTFLATLADMMLWVSADNDADSVNAGFWESTGVWFPFYFTFQIISYVTFAYIMLLMIFGFLHMGIHERLHMHMIHKIFVTMSLMMTITLIVFVSIRLRHLWHFIPELLQYIGPFLHLVALTVLTMMSWFVAGGLGTMQRRGMPLKDGWFWYFLVLIGLYITPIFIKSPCIMPQHHEENPTKPLLFAHRGAEEIAPENTNISFLIALDDFEAHGIKSDVRISLDGVPYVFHDDILTRTTNVMDVFPDNYRQPADMFSMDELRELDAGSWFARKKPFWSAWFTSEEEKEVYSQQGIMTMVDMFNIVLSRKRSLLFDLRAPPSEHPYATSWLNTTIDVITNEIGLNESEFTYWESPDGPHYVFFIQVYDNRTIQNVYNDISFKGIRNALENNVSTNVWTVNEAWLFQYYWCAGAESVTTSSVHTLSSHDSLVWQLTPTHYLIMWILFDIASFIWVIVVFIIQITLNRRRFRRLTRHTSDGSAYNYQFIGMTDKRTHLYPE